MAVADIYLKIDGVKGEAQDEQHKDEIEIQSWNWGAMNSGSMSSGTGGGRGKVDVHDLNISKLACQATPELVKAVCNHKHFPSAKLTVRKHGETPFDYLVVELTDVIITTYSTNGSGPDVHEDFKLNFAKFKLEYKSQSNQGRQSAAKSVTYDVKTHKIA